MKKSNKTSKKSDSAAATAASSVRSTSSFSKSVVSPIVTTNKETLISQSSDTLAHFGVQGSVVAGVTGQFTVPSSTAGGVAGPPLVGCPGTDAYFSGPQCMTGQFTVPSSATPAQGRATGLYSSGVYPCSASLGFRGSPTPRPQLDATSQPTSSMEGLFHSFMDCVSAFNPAFAANFAHPQARRGSTPAALGAPPPVSISAPAPFFDSGVRAPSVPTPFTSPHFVGLEVPLAAQSRFGFGPTPSPSSRFASPSVCFPSAYPSLSVSGSGVRGRAAHCLVSSPRFAASAQPAWNDPPPMAYGFSEPSHPAQDFYPDDPGEEFYSEVSDASSVSDELGQTAVNLLRKYLDQIYDPNSVQPSGVTSASGSDSGFFCPPPSSQSGISVPSDFLTEFDRVAASAALKPTPPVSAALAFPVSDVQAKSHFVTEVPSPGLLALGDEAVSGNPLKTKSFRSEDARWKFVSTASRFSLRLAAFSTALSDLLCRADELGVSADDRRAIADVLAAISEQLFSQSARAASFSVVQRRRIALSALGLERFADRFSAESVPIHGPFLFGGKFMEVVDEELVMQKRASDIARKVAPLSVRGTPSPFKRPFSGRAPPAKRFASSRGSRSFRGSRGSYRSATRGRSARSFPPRSFPSRSVPSFPPPTGPKSL